MEQIGHHHVFTLLGPWPTWTFIGESPTRARPQKERERHENEGEIWPKLGAITRWRLRIDYRGQSRLRISTAIPIKAFRTWEMWVNLVAIVPGSLQSVCLRCSMILFSGLLRGTSVLWLLTACWGRPATPSSVLEDRASPDEGGVGFDHFSASAAGSSELSCRSSLESRLAATPDCCPRGTFFGSGIHFVVSTLLGSLISVCRRSSTRRSVYFFRQSTSALRLRWLRGDRDGLRSCPLLSAGPALS